MSNTRRAKPLPAAEPAEVAPEDGVVLWDEFVAEAEPAVDPYRLRLPDGTLIEVGCPTSLQLEALAAAQVEGDVAGMVTALYAQDAEKLLSLSGGKPFTVRIKLINDLMFHFGLNLAKLPE